MRNLKQDAGTISGFGIASASATVSQVEENLNSLSDDIVTFMASNAGYETDAARVMLVRGMIETLGWGRAIRYFLTRYHQSARNMASIAANGAAGRLVGILSR
jgi:hypothetical protein